MSLARGLRTLGRVAVSNTARHVVPRILPASVKTVRHFPVVGRHMSSYEKDVTPMEGEKPKVNLYDGHYSDHMKEAQTKVRTYTYGDEGKCLFL